MPIATAAHFSRDVMVDVPNTTPTLQIRCRRPNLLAQIARGVLPQPLVKAALETLKAGNFDLVNTPPEEITQYAEFVDKWASVAAVEPRIVLTREEVVANPAAVCVDDLELDVKIAILRATIGPAAPAVDATLVEFRGEPDRTAAGSNGTAVRDAAVDAAADPGAGARA